MDGYETMSADGSRKFYKASNGARRTGIGGGKASQNRQHVIQTAARYDVSGKDAFKNNVNLANTPYPKNGDQIYDIVVDRPVFTFDELPNDDIYGNQKVLQCFNGAGADLMNLTDPEARRLALKSRTHFAGISVSSHDERSDGMELVTLSRGGTVSVYMNGDIAPADLVCWDIPTEDEDQKEIFFNRDTGEPATKTGGVLKKYEPQSISNRFIVYRNQMLEDEELFNKTFSTKSGIDGALKDHLNSQLASVVLGIYSLLSDSGNVRLANPNANLFDPAALTGQARRDAAVELCNRLAVGLGIVEPNASIVSTADANFFKSLRQSMLNTINWVNGEVNTAYGNVPFDPTSLNKLNFLQTSPNDPTTVQVATLAHNHGAQALAANSHFVMLDMQPVIGVCTDGSPKNSKATILLKTA